MVQGVGTAIPNPFLLQKVMFSYLALLQVEAAKPAVYCIHFSLAKKKKLLQI